MRAAAAILSGQMLLNILKPYNDNKHPKLVGRCFYEEAPIQYRDALVLRSIGRGAGCGSHGYAAA